MPWSLGSWHAFGTVPKQNLHGKEFLYFRMAMESNLTDLEGVWHISIITISIIQLNLPGLDQKQLDHFYQHLFFCRWQGYLIEKGISFRQHSPGQITIIPKPECFGAFWGWFPLLKPHIFCFFFPNRRYIRRSFGKKMAERNFQRKIQKKLPPQIGHSLSPKSPRDNNPPSRRWSQWFWALRCMRLIREFSSTGWWFRTPQLKLTGG